MIKRTIEFLGFLREPDISEGPAPNAFDQGIEQVGRDP